MDYGNPNIYTAVNDIKDNRELENVYEEIQKRVANRGLKTSGKVLDFRFESFLNFDMSNKFQIFICD